MADVQVPLAGSLVAAILESAGYHYQSALLDALQEPLTNQVGGLIYLVGIAIAVVHMAVQRSYRMTGWLMIGPPLFFAMILDRSDLQTSKWSFGNSERPQEAVEEGVRELTGATNQARVSTVFKKYIAMISTSSAAIVDTISKGRNKDDLWFVVKGQLYGLTTTSQEEDPRLKRIIHFSLLGQCRQVIEAAKAVNDPLRRFHTQNGNQSSVTAAFEQALVYLRPSQVQAQKSYNDLLNLRKVKLDKPGAEYVAFVEFGRAGEAGAIPTDQQISNIMAASYSCREIWDYALDGILRHAQRERQGLEREGKALGIEPEAIQNLWLQAHGIKSDSPISYDENLALTAQDTEAIDRIIAQFYLRNETRERDKGSLLANFVGRNDLRQVRTKLMGHNAYTEEARLGAEEWSEKERLMYAASSLPYYQGLALYFLGLTFPFFALLLLVPGKIGGFLLWFLLWLWVKSWDIGFAIVMHLDTILWALLAEQKQRLGRVDQLSDDLSTTMAALGTMDPTFNMTAYYAIISVCVLAIPPISAQLIMGSLRGGATIIASGARGYSDFFSDAMLTRMEQGAITQLKRDAALHKMERASLAHQNTQHGRAINLEPSGKVGTPLRDSAVKYGTQGAPGRAFNESTEQAKRDAGTAGRAEGLNNPSRNFSEGGGNKAIDAAIKGATAYDRIMPGYRAQAILTQSAADRTAVGNHANWNADIDAKAYEIHERIAILRGIPVPWSNFAQEGSMSELSRNLTQFQLEQELQAMNLKLAMEYLDSVASLSVQFLNAAQRAKVDAAGGIHNLPAGEKQELIKSLTTAQKQSVFKQASDAAKSRSSQAMRGLAMFGGGAAIASGTDGERGMLSTAANAAQSVFKHDKEAATVLWDGMIGQTFRNGGLNVHPSGEYDYKYFNVDEDIEYDLSDRHQKFRGRAGHSAK